MSKEQCAQIQKEARAFVNWLEQAEEESDDDDEEEENEDDVEVFSDSACVICVYDVVWDWLVIQAVFAVAAC